MLNNKVQWSMSCNRHRKKPILWYCCMQSIVHLRTDTSMSWLYMRTPMFMYLELHWQRTSRVPFFYQRRGTKTRMRYLDIKQLSAVLGDGLSQTLDFTPLLVVIPSAHSRSVKRQDRWSNWKRANKPWTYYWTSASRRMLHSWCIILWRRSPAVCNYICMHLRR